MREKGRHSNLHKSERKTAVKLWKSIIVGNIQAENRVKVLDIALK